jgi:hypothetical protein
MGARVFEKPTSYGTTTTFTPLGSPEAATIKSNIQESLELLSEYLWRMKDRIGAVRAALLYRHLFPNVHPVRATALLEGAVPGMPPDATQSPFFIADRLSKDFDSSVQQAYTSS